jgi:hypothetical protein
MAVSAACGTFNIGTGAAGTTVTVTPSPAITLSGATVIKFFWTGLTALSNGTRATSRFGTGRAVSASSFFAHATYDEDAAAVSVAKNNHATDCCIGEIDATGAFVGKADLQSLDANGFTLEIIGAFTTDLLVGYLIITGLDNAEIGTFTPAGVAPTNQTVNNAGNFQPAVTEFFFGGAVSSSADSTYMHGVATDATHEYVHWSGANDAEATANTASYNRAGECLAWNITSPPVGPTNRAEFVSHNAGPGGFTINWLERASATLIRYCSYKGGTWTLGDVLTQTDTTTAMTETGFGHAPVAVTLVSATKAETAQDATPGAHDERSVGCATSASSRFVMQMDSRDGNGTMFTHHAARSDCVYANSAPANTAYTLEGLMDVQSFDADGFTAIMDDADPAQAFAWYVAVGNVAAAGAFPWPYYQQMQAMAG